MPARPISGRPISGNAPITALAVTAREERAVLEELMLCAAPYVRSFGKGRNRTQERLLMAVNKARGIVKQPVPEPVIYDGTPTDPEALFRAYILAGGDWRCLVAAVNRFAGEASCLRYQMQKEKRQKKETAT